MGCWALGGIEFRTHLMFHNANAVCIENKKISDSHDNKAMETAPHVVRKHQNKNEN